MMRNDARSPMVPASATARAAKGVTQESANVTPIAASARISVQMRLARKEGCAIWKSAPGRFPPIASTHLDVSFSVCASEWRRLSIFRVEIDADPGEDAESRPLKSRRIFVALVEHIIDPRKERDAFAEIVVGREIHEKIRIGIEALDREAAVPVHLRADIKHGG